MIPVVEVRRNVAHAPWSYAALDRYQQDLAVRLAHADGDALPGRILISELAPVITLGRRECQQDVLLTVTELERSGIQLYQTDRGGRATYHGPGQWVVFVVDRLERITGDRRGVRRAVEGLLEVGRRVGEQYLGSQVHLRDGAAAGVWTSRGKLASVGVHVQQGVLLHGLAINGFQTGQSFLGLKPCGLEAEVDFLLEEHSEDRFIQIADLLQRELQGQFWNQG